MFDPIAIDKKIKELKETNLYTDEQLEAIRYACCRPDFDENLIIDPSIPADMMLMYARAAIEYKSFKIDISKYINEKWHLRGFNADQLKVIIGYDSKGFYIGDITPDMSVDEIIQIMNKRIEEERIKELLVYLTNEEIEFFKANNLAYNVANFLINKIIDGYDMSPFLVPEIKNFSFEQIQYLFTIHSTGYSIENIFDPSLSVEDMKKIMLNSKESRELLQEIIENHNQNKR